MKMNISTRARSIALGVKRGCRGLARQLNYGPFLSLFGLGLFVRIAAMVLYFPAWMQSYDELRFARIDPTGGFSRIFSDYWMPAGFALFARTMREIVPALWVSIAAQHLIGLTIGVSLFLAMRRLGAKPWLACVPAGVAFLSGDEIWIEHQIMSEPFVTALVAAGLALSIRGLVPRLDLRWLAASSAVLMTAGLSRNVALVGLPVLIICVFFWVRGSASSRARAVGAAVLPALLVFGIYVAAFALNHGKYLGIANMSGWNLYARVAPFADCSKFTPPPDTRRLCESTPPAQRDGSLGYQWDADTIGRRNFPLGPQTNSKMGGFARQVILHQPLEYIKAVATDAARYVEPNIGPNLPFSGESHEIQSFGLVDPVTREFMEEQMAFGYSGTTVHAHGKRVLATYQELFRVGGLLLAAFLVFTVVGMFVAKGPIRLGIFLFGLTGFGLYLVPVATLSYEVRYGLPPLPFVVVSGTLGFAALIAKRRRPAAFEPLPSDS